MRPGSVFFFCMNAGSIVGIGHWLSYPSRSLPFSCLVPALLGMLLFNLVGSLDDATGAMVETAQDPGWWFAHAACNKGADKAAENLRWVFIIILPITLTIRTMVTFIFGLIDAFGNPKDYKWAWAFAGGVTLSLPLLFCAVDPGSGRIQGYSVLRFSLPAFFYGHDAAIRHRQDLAHVKLDNEDWNALNEGMEAAKNKDYNKAFRLLQPLADRGITDAQLTLGKIWAWGEGFDTDMKKGAALIKAAGDNGHYHAAYVYGMMIQNNEVAYDEPQMVYYLRQAALGGSACGMLEYGRLFGGGIGVPKDGWECVRWVRAAMLKDKDFEKFRAWVRFHVSDDQLLYCGMPNFQGHFTGKNVRNIVDCCRLDHFAVVMTELKAEAKRGSSICQFLLGWAYEFGKGGLKPDKLAAISWYKKAARAGERSGSWRLGILAIVDGDYKQARSHLYFAGNLPEVQWAMGALCIREGDHFKAAEYFHSAVENGNSTPARRALENVWFNPPDRLAPWEREMSKVFCGTR